LVNIRKELMFCVEDAEGEHFTSEKEDALLVVMVKVLR
jgi:hypothetical protein